MKVCRRGHEYSGLKQCQECKRITNANWNAARSLEQIEIDTLTDAKRYASRSPEQREHDRVKTLVVNITPAQREHRNARQRYANLTPARREHDRARRRARYLKEKEKNENTSDS